MTAGPGVTAGAGFSQQPAIAESRSVSGRAIAVTNPAPPDPRSNPAMNTDTPTKTTDADWIEDRTGETIHTHHRDSRRVPVQVGDTVGSYSLAASQAVVVEASANSVMVELRNGLRESVSYTDLALQHVGPPVGGNVATPTRPGFWVNLGAGARVGATYRGDGYERGTVVKASEDGLLVKPDRDLSSDRCPSLDGSGCFFTPWYEEIALLDVPFNRMHPVQPARTARPQPGTRITAIIEAEGFDATVVESCERGCFVKADALDGLYGVPWGLVQAKVGDTGRLAHGPVEDVDDPPAPSNGIFLAGTPEAQRRARYLAHQHTLISPGDSPALEIVAHQAVVGAALKCLEDASDAGERIKTEIEAVVNTQDQPPMSPLPTAGEHDQVRAKPTPGTETDPGRWTKDPP